jgi:hypothetical protein
MIYSVTGPNNSGPWLPVQGGQLTIVSAGSNVEVLNPYYDPAQDGSQRTIRRDYGFGASAGPNSRVTLGTTQLTVLSWSNDLITVSVPAGTSSAQLTVVRDGQPSTVGLTVTVGGSTPKYVAAGGSIQAVLDSPTTIDGDLVIVPPGIYNTSLIMDKKVRLQGWGAMSTMINAAKASTASLKDWRTLLMRKIDARPTNPPVIDPDTGQNTLVAGNLRTFDLLPGQTLGHDLSNNEPLLFGAEEAPGVLVVGKTAANGAGSGHFNATNPARIDGLSITGADTGGGILISGYGRNVQISNNRVFGNAGTYGGGIRIGHTALLDDANTSYGGYTDSVDPNVNIHHNWIASNGGTEFGAGGGIAIGNGATNYQVLQNHVCGNFTLGDGGGIGQRGLADGGLISSNRVIFNQTYNQAANPTGGGIFIGGAASVGAVGNSAGSGSVTVTRNLVQGNNAGAGFGGGIRLAQVNGLDVGRAPNNPNLWNAVTLTNNIVVDNLAGAAAGGVSLVDALRVTADNNTIAFNDTTATSQQAFANPGENASRPQPAGVVSEVTSAQLLGTIGTAALRSQYRFSNPALINNIVWHNRAFCWAITGPGPGQFGLFDPTASGGCNTASPAGTNPVYVDLAVIGTAASGNFANRYVGAGVDKLTPDHSILSDLLGPGGYDNGRSNKAADPLLVSGYANGNRKPSPFVPGFTTAIDTAATSDEGGNFIDIRYGPLTLWNCLAPDGSVRTPQNAANCPLFGDYHLRTGSPAIDAGLAASGSNGVPSVDFDGDARPGGPATDIGADEVAAAAVPFVPPALPVLDNFNRANSNSLGGSWQQLVIGSAALRVNAQHAQGFVLGGNAYWSGAFGTRQGAAFTFVGTPATGTSLLLKASGTFVLGTYVNFVRVRYSGGQVLVDTTTNGGLSYANQRTVATGVSFAPGDTLGAIGDAAGTVTVWKLAAGGAVTVLGQASLPVTGTTAFVAGAGRTGMQLPTGASVDDFRAATVP